MDKLDSEEMKEHYRYIRIHKVKRKMYTFSQNIYASLKHFFYNLIYIF